MYVDDSGSPNPKDNIDYYVISGVIIHELDIRQFEIRTQQYKNKHFREYEDVEIHVHDIYKSQCQFSSLFTNKLAYFPVRNSNSQPHRGISMLCCYQDAMAELLSGLSCWVDHIYNSM